MTKAEALLSHIESVKVNSPITWKIYEGNDPLDAKTVQSYVEGFFQTANLMPIPVVNLGLDILSVETEFDDQAHTYSITVEGMVRKFLSQERL